MEFLLGKSEIAWENLEDGGIAEAHKYRSKSMPVRGLVVGMESHALCRAPAHTTQQLT